MCADDGSGGASSADATGGASQGGSEETLGGSGGAATSGGASGDTGVGGTQGVGGGSNVSGTAGGAGLPGVGGSAGSGGDDDGGTAGSAGATGTAGASAGTAGRVAGAGGISAGAGGIAGATAGGAGAPTRGGAAGSATAGEGGADAAGGTPATGGECAFEMCGEDCVDTSTDENHCGSCNHACSGANAVAPLCLQGECAPTCLSGYADCSRPAAGDPDDGCETNLRTDANHCGACDQGCSSGSTCFEGSCTCVVLPPSCSSGLDCGGVSCCTAISLPGGSYYSGHDVTVGPFCLDVFEVTIGRFQAFMAEYDTWLTGVADGDGTHPLIQWEASSLATAGGDTATWPAACRNGCSTTTCSHTPTTRVRTARCWTMRGTGAWPVAATGAACTTPT